MVSQKYRWDFIGLSTDDKPTSETSDKVVNGSTYYCSDTSKLYVYCDGTWYERKPLGGGGGGGGTSDFDELDNRPKYNGSLMTGDTNIPLVPTVNNATLTVTQNGTSAGTFTANSSTDTTIALTDTTYSNFTGTDGTAAGVAGLVPAPATTDAGKFLKADGTWDTAGGGGGPTVVQTTGTSTTDVMSQNAVSTMVYADPGTDTMSMRKIRLGAAASVNANQGTAIGAGSTISGAQSIAITGGNNSMTISGRSAIGIGSGEVTADGAISLGLFTPTNSTQGKIEVGTVATWTGYNNSNYRLLTGVYDGQGLHDAATVAQGNTLSTSAPTTSTEGVLGQLWTDTTNMHTYQCTAISGSTYTWTQRW